MSVWYNRTIGNLEKKEKYTRKINENKYVHSSDLLCVGGSNFSNTGKQKTGVVTKFYI